MTSHVARMSTYADDSLCITEKPRDVLTTTMNQGEFQIEATGPVPLSADGDDRVVDVKWVGLDESEMTWETVHHIHKDTPPYLANQLKNMKLTKDICKALRTKYGVRILSWSSESGFVREKSALSFKNS